MTITTNNMYDYKIQLCLLTCNYTIARRFKVSHLSLNASTKYFAMLFNLRTFVEDIINMYLLMVGHGVLTLYFTRKSLYNGQHNKK